MMATTDTYAERLRAWIAQNPIRARRKDTARFGPRGLSQADLAAQIGYSVISVLLWEKGGSTPQREAFAALARFFGAPFLASEWGDWYARRPAPPGKGGEAPEDG